MKEKSLQPSSWRGVEHDQGCPGRVGGKRGFSWGADEPTIQDEVTRYRVHYLTGALSLDLRSFDGCPILSAS